MSSSIAKKSASPMDGLAREILALHNEANRLASDAVATAIQCGRKLLEANERAPHGSFLLWLAQSLPELSRRTAYNYMALAKKASEAGGDSLDSHSLTRLYEEMGIVKPSGFGGRREGAGRPRKDAAVDFDPELEMAAAEGAYSRLFDFAVTRDGFAHLRTGDLRAMVTRLEELSSAARRLLDARERAELNAQRATSTKTTTTRRTTK